jgi:hypothetical protein
MTKDNTRLYWAYGSNLSLEAMARRCPKATPVRSLTVSAAALIFRGVADVKPREGASVPGGLWRITPACERALDGYEGVAGGLYRKRYIMVAPTKGKKKIPCLFYQMTADRGVQPPSEHYLKVIAQGYRDFGLDLNILDEYVQESWGNKKVTDHLKSRHIYRGSPMLARSVAEAEALYRTNGLPPQQKA